MTDDQRLAELFDRIGSTETDFVIDFRAGNFPAAAEYLVANDVAASIQSPHGTAHEFVEQRYGERCLAVARCVDHPLGNQRRP